MNLLMFKSVTLSAALGIALLSLGACNGKATGKRTTEPIFTDPEAQKAYEEGQREANDPAAPVAGAQKSGSQTGTEKPGSDATATTPAVGTAPADGWSKEGLARASDYCLENAKGGPLPPEKVPAVCACVIKKVQVKWSEQEVNTFIGNADKTFEKDVTSLGTVCAISGK